MTTMLSNQTPDPNQDRNKPQTNGTEPEGYITKEEVAKRLKKTVRTVENWQARGIIPFVKAGRSVLFKWSDVEGHLQSNFRICRKA
jgi:excisionase family DNA binding protein